MGDPAQGQAPGEAQQRGEGVSNYFADTNQDRRKDGRRISPAVGERAIQQMPPLAAEIDRLRVANAELVAVIENALVSIRVCSLSLVGPNVAGNETILRITADGLRAAVAVAKAEA